MNNSNLPEFDTIPWWGQFLILGLSVLGVASALYLDSEFERLSIEGSRNASGKKAKENVENEDWEGI